MKHLFFSAVFALLLVFSTTSWADENPFATHTVYVDCKTAIRIADTQHIATATDPQQAISCLGYLRGFA